MSMEMRRSRCITTPREALYQYVSEYNSRGFKTRVISNSFGKRDELKVSEPDWIDRRYQLRQYNNTPDYDEGTSFHRYDSNGNEIEWTYKREDGDRMQVFYKYDRQGKLVEEEAYRNGSSVVGAFLYTYELDHYGNWIKQVKRWKSEHDCPIDEVIYRE